MPREVGLEVGETYFSIFYADEALLHPIFETLVYLGPEMIDDEGAGPVPGHLFQYASSFHSDGNWKEMTDIEREAFDEPPVVTYEDAHIDPVVDAEGLIGELARWQARIG